MLSIQRREQRSFDPFPKIQKVPRVLIIFPFRKYRKGPGAGQTAAVSCRAFRINFIAILQVPELHESFASRWSLTLRSSSHKLLPLTLSIQRDV
jgi:hypothetical protein